MAIVDIFFGLATIADCANLRLHIVTMFPVFNAPWSHKNLNGMNPKTLRKGGLRTIMSGMRNLAASSGWVFGRKAASVPVSRLYAYVLQINNR